MKDKYENSRTKQKNKKQKVCGQDSCPTSAITLHNTGRSHNCHLSQCGTSIQLSLTLHNVGPTHNCHSFYTTSTPLPRNCRHPRQHIHPCDCHPSYITRDSHRTIGLLRNIPHGTSVAGEGALREPLAPPFPPPTLPAKEPTWGVWGERTRLSRLHASNSQSLGNFLLTKTACRNTCPRFLWLPLRWVVEGEDTQDHLTGLRASSPADSALHSLLHT